MSDDSFERAGDFSAYAVGVPPAIYRLAPGPDSRPVSTTVRFRHNRMVTLDEEDLPTQEPSVSEKEHSTQATSVAEVAPDIEVPVRLDRPESAEGQELVGRYEALIGSVEMALEAGVWNDRPLAEDNIRLNCNALRNNLYATPEGTDLTLAGSLARNLARRLIGDVVPAGAVKDFTESLVTQDRPEDPRDALHRPADRLAEVAGRVDAVPEGRNSYEWTARILGWVSGQPAAVAGTFSTIGVTYATASGLKPEHSAIVGVVFGFVAATLAYASTMIRDRVKPPENSESQDHT